MFKKRSRTGKFIDVHSHVLPGLDDGSKDIDETIKMLEIASRDGVTDIIATPHYKRGRRNASIKTIYERISYVETEAKSRGLEISLYPGQEIFYYGDLAEHLEGGSETLTEERLLTMNGTGCVLIEFMPGEQYASIRNGMDSVRGCGYTPILAHAERYECLLKNWKLVKELKQMNCEIQINASSINGELGHTVRKFVHQLLDERLVDYIGTDAHDAKKRTPSIQKCMDHLYKKYDSEYVDAILYENAMALITTEE